MQWLSTLLLVVGLSVECWPVCWHGTGANKGCLLDIRQRSSQMWTMPWVQLECKPSAAPPKMPSHETHIPICTTRIKTHIESRVRTEMWIVLSVRIMAHSANCSASHNHNPLSAHHLNSHSQLICSQEVFNNHLQATHTVFSGPVTSIHLINPTQPSHTRLS